MDGKVAVKVVLTTDGYVPYTITADLYSASFDNLLELTSEHNSEEVTTLSKEDVDQTVAARYSFCILAIQPTDWGILDIVYARVTLINPYPPPSGPSPPPPALGSISGSGVLFGEMEIHFKISIVGYKPKGLRIVIFDPVGIALEMHSVDYTGPTMDWYQEINGISRVLQPPTSAQVLAYQTNGATSPALTISLKS